MHRRLTLHCDIRNDPLFRRHGILVGNMELRDLRYFVVVAEHLNLGRAAEALDLSATALGKSLRRLEQSVGSKLVQRTSKGVALTAVGAALLNRIAPLQGMLNDVRHEATDLAQGRAGHLHVGASFGPNEGRMAHAFVSLLKEAPGITLKVTPGDNNVFSNLLRKGEIDFCISGSRSLSPAEFVLEQLYDDSFVVIASAHHRLAKRKQLSVTDLVGERWVSQNNTALAHWQELFRMFERNRLPQPAVALVASSTRVRAIAIANSNLIGLSNRQTLQQEIRRHPLVELPVKEFTCSQNVLIIYRKNAYLSPAALRLIEILKMQARQLADGATKERSAKRMNTRK